MASWSVIASIDSPREDASRVSSAGDSAPSETVVWQCRSTGTSEPEDFQGDIVPAEGRHDVHSADSTETSHPGQRLARDRHTLRARRPLSLRPAHALPHRLRDPHARNLV